MNSITIPRFNELRPKKLLVGSQAKTMMLTDDGYLYYLPVRGPKKYFWHLVEELHRRFIVDIIDDGDRVLLLSRARKERTPPPPSISYRSPFGTLADVF